MRTTLTTMIRDIPFRFARRANRRCNLQMKIPKYWRTEQSKFQLGGPFQERIPSPSKPYETYKLSSDSNRTLARRERRLRGKMSSRRPPNKAGRCPQPPLPASSEIDETESCYRDLTCWRAAFIIVAGLGGGSAIINRFVTQSACAGA